MVKSIFVVAPNKANIAKTTAVIRNTNIIEVISYTTKILENVNPLTNEYNKKLILAVIGFILVILADKKNTKANSTITININPVVLMTFNNIFGFIEIPYPVKNVTKSPINIQPNVLAIVGLFKFFPSFLYIISIAYSIYFVNLLNFCLSYFFLVFSFIYLYTLSGDIMKVLSLREPFASLIAEKKKLIETRSWKTNYRGELYIHASKSKALNDEQELLSFLSNSLHYGQILCKCKLKDCIYMTKEFVEDMKLNHPDEYLCDEYAVGRYAWILENIEPLKKLYKLKELWYMELLY